MPELPEIETLRQTLSTQLMGRSIQGIQCIRPQCLNLPLKECESLAVGGTVTTLERRGKTLLLHLDNGSCIVIHLMMGGEVRFVEPEAELEDGWVILFYLADGSRLLMEKLRFGYAHFYREEELEGVDFLQEMGPDPLSGEFTEESFQRMLLSKKTKIKPLLCDQSFLAGIGNEYSAEILFRAKIHPNTPANSLSRRKQQELYKAIRGVLSEAVEEQLKGGYFDFQVMDREGEECTRCSGTIKKVKLGGRSTYFCPNCQKM